MPKLEISLKDLELLAGKAFNTTKELENALMFAKAELDSGGVEEEDALRVDVKDTNRPDMWSAEGVGREISGRIAGRKGCPQYKVGKGNLVVYVDGKSKIKSVRPYTVCAVVKNLEMTDNIILQMIQLQEKICTSFGRNRREVAIGVYDYGKIKSPVTYTTTKKDGIKFVPLGDAMATYGEMTLAEILEKHPTGRAFAHLLADADEYPIFIDASKNVLSMPPIINSDYTGKVTTDTKDLFIECSGFDLRFLLPALNCMVAALADRGGRIESVKMVYPASYGKTVSETPDMSLKRTEASLKKIKEILGVSMSDRDVVGMLEQARYDVTVAGDKLKLEYPCYRQDIMHWRDVLEDVLVSYGYNNIKPEMKEMFTRGALLPKDVFCSKLSDILTGAGLQEVMSYNLTNKKALFEKTRLSAEKVAEIENAVSETWCVFRSWLLPSVMDFLSKNKHNEYPQAIFEIGDVIIIDEKAETKTKDVRKLAVALTDTAVNYEQISSVLDALMRALGIEYMLNEAEHASFISGRAASIAIKGKNIGIVGEIHPQTLNNWGIETPVLALELDADELYKMASK